jgi:nitroreductase
MNKMNEILLSALNTRYATKKFDATKKVPSETIEALIEAIRLTPTSYGLQLMKVVLVENKALREELVPHAFGQQQIADASHLIILCRELDAQADHIDAYIENIADTRSIHVDHLSGFRNMMYNTVLKMTPAQQEDWMKQQVYIALGNLLTSCAILEIDACPMEGFLPSEFDRILGLEEMNLSSVLVIPIGYRAEDDKNASLKKVRRPLPEFLVTI